MMSDIIHNVQKKEPRREGTNLAGTEVGTLGAAVGASGRLTEGGCC